MLPSSLACKRQCGHGGSSAFVRGITVIRAPSHSCFVSRSSGLQCTHACVVRLRLASTATICKWRCSHQGSSAFACSITVIRGPLRSSFVPRSSGLQCTRMCAWRAFLLSPPPGCEQRWLAGLKRIRVRHHTFQGSLALALCLKVVWVPAHSWECLAYGACPAIPICMQWRRL